MTPKSRGRSPPPSTEEHSQEHATKKQKHEVTAAEELLDAASLAALRSRSDPFLQGSDPVVTEEQVIAAVNVASSNKDLEQFGIDGTGCKLCTASSKALGGMKVKFLVFPLTLEFTTAGREAFIHALGSNSSIEVLRLGTTNLDGELEETWRPEGSAFVAEVQQLRERKQLPLLRVDGFTGIEVGEDDRESDDEGEGDGESEGESEGEGDGEGESEEEDGDVVQCDKRDCRRELTGADDVVYTSSFGLDYCSKCVAQFPADRRAGLRQTTVAARSAE